MNDSYAVRLLREVYKQCGNHAPAERRHALTPALRDEIRDFLQEPNEFCEHGVRDGDWCHECNAAYKRAITDNHGTIE